MLFKFSISIMSSSTIPRAIQKLKKAHQMNVLGSNSAMVIETLGEAKEDINMEIVRLGKKMVQFERDPNPLPVKHQSTAISLLEEDLGVPQSGNTDHEYLSLLLDAKGIPENQPHSIRARMALPNLDSITKLIGSQQRQQQPYGVELGQFGDDLIEDNLEFVEVPNYIEYPQPQEIEYEIDF